MDLHVCNSPLTIFPLVSQLLTQCSASCGKGVKKRAVRCIASRGLALSDAECNAAARPHEEATCYLPACETTTIHIAPPTSAGAPASSGGGQGAAVGPASSSGAGGVATGEQQPAAPPQPPASASHSSGDQSPTQWRTGSWTSVSPVFSLLLSGSGGRMRFLDSLSFVVFFFFEQI